MKRILLILFLTILAVSCNEPEPRKPVSRKTGSFLRESIERNKDLLRKEETSIKSIIDKDTTHTYLNSSNGYWYYYNVKNTLSSYTPKTDDVVMINYNIRTLENDTIYTNEEIGNIKFKVDKEDYFPGLRTGIKLMKKGEEITFLFPSVMGYGYHGDDHKIGTNQPLISTIKLIDIIEIAKDSLNNEN
ncbi:gliding motility-associated peptidyl-prolyl isomerase GldI [Zhouia spongiae]|uniref:Peptidyl-prolyl cis-trans isomerase n=1 Tax=Zhouia spongiae TaxID=2202721 RepID=A0ABY3YK61_9FLAO|nr:gliding motility-associated peptidyl-prolyl isomerase GldI [Zhouia spongiae]UNY97548.1 gliding motility-associated peptidyl-prolyl isomerase GldI [Zhouia spongiae]